MANTPVLELESLFVKIFADATKYFSEIKKVMSGNEEVTSSFKKIGKDIALVNRAYTDVASSIKTLAVATGTLTEANSFLTQSMAAYRLESNSVMAGNLKLMAFENNMAAAIRATTRELKLKALAMSIVENTVAGYPGARISGANVIVPTTPLGLQRTTANASNFYLGQLQEQARVSVAASARAASLVASGGTSFVKPETLTLTDKLHNAFVRMHAGKKNLDTTFNKNIRQTIPGLGSAFGGARTPVMLFTAAIAFSVYEFAKFDKAMSTTLMHMKDWSQTNRTALTEGVFEISRNSMSSVMDLTSGLDALRGAGFNAAASIKALAIVQKFSVASSMDMAHASDTLVRLMNSLHLITNDVTKNYAEMRRLSDLLTGTAFELGTSQEKFAEAFTHRFAGIMNFTHMSLQEGAALLAMFHRAGARGSEGGDMAFRLVEQTMMKSTENIYKWKRLGIEVFDPVSKQMRPFADIIEQIRTTFEKLTPEGRVAALSFMGFETRTISATLEVIGMANEMKALQDRMQGFTGDTDKAAAVLENSFSGALTKSKNALERYFITLGEVFAPVVRVFTWLINKLEELTSMGVWGIKKLLSEFGLANAPDLSDLRGSEAQIRKFQSESAKAAEKMTRDIKSPLQGTPGEGLPGVEGKQHPGFKFEQISLARMMLGGPVAATLEKQQLDWLKIIAGKMDNLARAIRGEPAGPVMPAGVRESVDAMLPKNFKASQDLGASLLGSLTVGQPDYSIFKSGGLSSAALGGLPSIETNTTGGISSAGMSGLPMAQELPSGNLSFAGMQGLLKELITATKQNKPIPAVGGP